MPYRRPYRRRTTRRKKPPSRWKTYGRAGRQLAKDVMMLKGLINTEFKSADPYNGTIINPGVSPVITLLNGLTQGDDISNREGRQIRLKSVDISQAYSMNGAAFGTIIRMMLVLDKQPNGAVFNSADLLQNTDTVAFRQLDNRRRFLILEDRKYTISSTGPIIGYDRVYKEIDIKTTYDDSNAGTIADIETNALYLLFISNEATNVPQVRVSARIRWLDN